MQEGAILSLGEAGRPFSRIDRERPTLEKLATAVAEDHPGGRRSAAPLLTAWFHDGGMLVSRRYSNDAGRCGLAPIESTQNDAVEQAEPQFSGE
jgi:hypothetical protein